MSKLTPKKATFKILKVAFLFHHIKLFNFMDLLSFLTAFTLTSLTDWLDSFQYVSSGKHPHKYKIFFKNNNTQPLFDFLEEIGFFEFYCSKQARNTASYHQVVAYLFSGGLQAYTNGFTCNHIDPNGIQLHHLDGNTFNNHSRNLQYIPRNVHSICTKVQRTYNKHMKLFDKIDTSTLICFSRKGKQIVDFKEWFKNILIKTIVLTSQHYRTFVPLKATIKFLINIFKKYFNVNNIKFITNDNLIQSLISSYVSAS